MEQNRGKKAREWSDIFSDWRRSGESQRGYCRDKGISISAFGYWHRKLERDGVEQSFVKVRNVGSIRGTDTDGLTVRAGGVLVELSGQESEEILMKVFRALQAIS
jgi:hypothetical protein